MKTCLSIAGSDSSGGAGIQADLKTFAAHGFYGSSVISAITAQNTQGIFAIEAISANLLRQQLNAVLDDIRPDAVKIGMLATAANVEVVAELLDVYQINHVVFDPVMRASVGTHLLNTNALQSLVQNLLPQVDIITPNIDELMTLCRLLDIDIPSKLPASTIAQLSETLYAALPKHRDGHRTAILTTGGHLEGDNADDILIYQQHTHWLRGAKIASQNHHGTGCTLSSALCAQLAQGHNLIQACKNAKEYLNRCLDAQLNLGQGNGPLWHGV